MKEDSLEPMLAVLMLGTNQGDRQSLLSDAIQRINDGVGEIDSCSSVYETAAWGVTDQPHFLNQLVVVRVVLEPFELLNRIHEIERTLGRQRSSETRWGSRTMDIDILYIDQRIIETPTLNVPHPQIQHRKFVLLPLNEVLPDFLHPLLKLTSKEMLNSCSDALKVEMIQDR